MNIEKQNANSAHMLEKCGGRCRPSRSIVSGSRKVEADGDGAWLPLTPFSSAEGLAFSAMSLGFTPLDCGCLVAMA